MREWTWSLLKDFVDEAYVGLRPDQNHGTQLKKENVIFDQFLQKGPLASLHAAHEFSPASHWLVCACDFPNLEPEALSLLKKAFLEKPNHEVWCYSEQGQPQPLLGIYSPRALAGVKALLESDQNRGPMALLQHNCFFMEPKYPHWLKNANSAQDWLKP